MGMCKGCKTVYSSLIMNDGYCRDCKPELFSEDGEPIKEGAIEKALRLEKETQNLQEETKDNQICGIVSCVLGILSLFTGAIGIIFAIIGLIRGISNSKNAFGIIGIIVSSIYLGLFLLGVLGFASILALN